MAEYEYWHTKYGRCGIMICCSCNKPITEGQYRVRDTPDRFVLWHRECCKDDPEWGRIDAVAWAHEKYLQEYKQACKEFVAKWGIPGDADFEDLD